VICSRARQSSSSLEQFVEIRRDGRQQGMRVACLNGMILLHQRWFGSLILDGVSRESFLNAEIRQQESVIQRNFAQIIIAPEAPPCPAPMLISAVGDSHPFQRAQFRDVFRRLPVLTWLSFSPVLAKIAGKASLQIVVGTYTSYEIVFCDLWISPFLVSPTVSGSDASSMVFSTSTKGRG